MNKNLFRKSALEKLSYPEQLGEYIKITNPGAWIVAVGCIALLVAVIVWLALGSIPDTIAAKGILFPASGTITITAPAGGKISDMRVKAGSSVNLHDIIAVIPQQDILSEIEILQQVPQPDEKVIAQKQQEFHDQSMVRAPLYGTVLWTRYLNEVVAADEALASIAVIEEGTNNYAVIAYVDTTTAKRLQAGMEVQISPSFSSREEYGYMYGRITKVGEYPVSEDDIRASVGNMQYVENILPQNTFVEVQIDILLDANKDNSRNTAKWSNPIGNELDLTIGTECELLIVMKEQKPYELVF